MTRNQEIGKASEDYVAKYLEQRGSKILARNFAVHNVGEIVGSDELAIITLTDEPQERMITIVCDKAMAVQLELRAKQIPITRIMLPEVLAGILKDQAGIMMDILITDIIEGQYRTLLYNRVTLETVPIRASDAVPRAFQSEEGTIGLRMPASRRFRRRRFPRRSIFW